MRKCLKWTVLVLIVFLGSSAAIGAQQCGQCEQLVENSCIKCENLGLECQAGRCACPNCPRQMATLLQSATMGDANAQNRLCQIYIYGGMVPRDCVEAAKWFLRAAEQEQAESQYTLGSLYEKGCGVERNLEESLRWRRLAASKGYAPAAFSLGFSTRTGSRGFRRDEKEALRWFEIGARQGHIPSMECYFGQPFDLLDLETQARQKNVKAQSFLGIRLYNRAHFNSLLSDDKKASLYREAVNWLSKASNAGDADAQYVLAKMYDNGNGVDKDVKKAFELMQKAARGGNPFARDFIKGRNISR